MYGGSGRHTSLAGFAKSQSERLFNVPLTGTLKLYGSKDQPRESAWVHVDDLAQVYVLVAKHNVRGERFPVQVENLDNHAVTIACARAAGWNGEIEYEPDVSKADDQLVGLTVDLPVIRNFSLINSCSSTDSDDWRSFNSRQLPAARRPPRMGAQTPIYGGFGHLLRYLESDAAERGVAPLIVRFGGSVVAARDTGEKY